MLEFKSASSNPRVTSLNSRVASSNPRVTSSNPWVMSSNLRVTSSNPQVTSSNQWVRRLKTTNCKIKTTNWDIKIMSGLIKSTSWSYKTTSYIVNKQVKRKNSEFKIMDFTSYKNFYFYCLANAEFKPHRKILKNLFHNMTLEKHIWPLYYHHILAENLRSIDSNKTQSVMK